MDSQASKVAFYVALYYIGIIVLFVIIIIIIQQLNDQSNTQRRVIHIDSIQSLRFMGFHRISASLQLYW